MNYIKNIRILKTESKFNKNDTLISQIIIEPKILLTSPPLIECLDYGDVYVFSPKRGHGYTWIYNTELQQFDRPKRINRFLLEVIKIKENSKSSYPRCKQRGITKLFPSGSEFSIYGIILFTNSSQPQQAAGYSLIF